ncbi:MAG: tetratricopeptide repeat protein, partial [Planctomycetota bacterium]
MKVEPRLNRATLLAGLILVLLTCAIGLRPAPSFSLADLPGPLQLPETLAPVVVSPAPSAWPGLILLGVSALLLLVWRRAMGHPPGLALLPALILLVHPAQLSAVLTGDGRLDLAALLLVLLGAVFLASDRAAFAAAGIVLLILSVLAAPSGAPLAALAAFVLLERVPPMHRGAGLLIMLGLARGLGAPSLLVSLKGDVQAAAASIDFPTFSLTRSLETVASLLPGRPVLEVPGVEPVAVGAGLLLLLVLGVIALAPQRRFGGRWTALLGLGSLLLLALSSGQDRVSGPGALLAPLVLLASWLASLGDDVQRGALRPALAWSLSLGLLAVLVGRSVRQLDLFESREAFFQSVAKAEPHAADQDGLSLLALRARLRAAGPEEVGRLALHRLSLGAPASARTAVVDRELAIAAAQNGWTDRALQLIDRAWVGIRSEVGDGPLPSIHLDRIDVAVRAGDPELALALCNPLVLAARENRQKAQVLSRRGALHAGLAFQAEARGGGVDLRDRELTQAREDFAAAIDLDADCVRAFLDRGRFELALGNAIAAIKDLEQAARLRPALAAPRLELAKLYFAADQSDAGERELSQAKELASASDPDVRLVTAQLLLARGDLAGAVKSAEAIRARMHQLTGGANSLSELYAILAVSAEETRNRGVAEEMAKKALELGHDRKGKVTQCLSRILRQERRYDELVELLQLAERRSIPVPNLQTELSLAFKNAGYARFVAKDRASAFAQFLEAVRRSPEFDDLGALPSLLCSLAEGTDDSDREALAEQARRAFEMGVSRYQDEKFEQAQKLLLVSIDLLPQNPFAHYSLGLVLDRTGKPEEARREYLEALGLAEALGQDDLARRLK